MHVAAETFVAALLGDEQGEEGQVVVVGREVDREGSHEGADDIRDDRYLAAHHEARHDVGADGLALGAAELHERPDEAVAVAEVVLDGGVVLLTRLDADVSQRDC